MTVQASIDRLVQACRGSGISVYALLDRPFVDIIAFADQHSIPVEDLKDICGLLIERLDAFTLDLNTIGKLALH